MSYIAEIGKNSPSKGQTANILKKIQFH